MRIFIDESGSFNWHNPGKSLFCGVTVPDRGLDALYERFARWRRTIIGHSKRELKGSELTENQLTLFAAKVLVTTDQDVWLTVVGIDTCLTQEAIISRLRDQAAIIFDQSSRLAKEHHNAKLEETYRQMSGWVRNRSPQNVLWVIALIETLTKSLNHAIVRFAEPEDDVEFDNIKIQIDQSFVKRDEHVAFWREWLRVELAKSSRTERLITIKEWRERDHPFIKRYSIYPGIANLRKLYLNDTGFFSSERSPGLQIADICAHILYRHHRNAGADKAYTQLKRRIVCRRGAEINILHVDESSLHKDDPRNHVGVFDIEEYKKQADAIRAAKAN
jgi:Protein of unknown function (DUF3800)